MGTYIFVLYWYVLKSQVKSHIKKLLFFSFREKKFFCGISYEKKSMFAQNSNQSQSLLVSLGSVAPIFPLGTISHCQHDGDSNNNASMERDLSQGSETREQ